MSYARPAGESDFDSTDEDDLFAELCSQSTTRTRSSLKESGEKTVTEVSKEEALKCPDAAAAVEQRNPMVLHDMQTAISTGNVAAVERLLEKVDGPDVLLNSGWPLIVHAAYFCHHSIVQLLIKQSANINAVNDTGDTALHAACKSGIDPNSQSVLTTVSELVSFGANVDAKDFNGRTPLMYACRKNLATIVKYLLETDGNPHKRIYTRDDRDWNCIDWCAIFGNIESLKVIINMLKIKIDPKKFMSSKLWSNHVFEFLQTSNRTLDMEPCQTIGLYDQNMTTASVIRSSAQTTTAIVSTDVQKSSTTVDTDEPNQGCMESSNKNQTYNGEHIGDMYLPGKDADVEEQADTNVEMRLETTTFNCGMSTKSAAEGDALLDSEDEECILPTVIKRDINKVESYLTYGHLELFLAGLELTHLIPLFEKQDIKFEELLCLSMDELEKIGIKAYGTRRRIFAAIQECHEKHTSTSLLPDYTKTPLTTETMFRMMNGSSEQIEYIASCMRYVKYHVGMYPDTLYPDANETYEKAPLQSYHEKIDGLTRSLVNLAKSLDDLKSQADDFERDTCPELIRPIGLATLDNLKDCDQRAKMKRLFAISIAVLAFYMWKKSSLFS